jgi:hypothetical protein
MKPQKESKMGRRKGSKNKPKVDAAGKPIAKATKPAAKAPKKAVKAEKPKAAKPKTVRPRAAAPEAFEPKVETLGTPAAPVAKQEVEQAPAKANSARRTKDGGVVIQAPKDSDDKPVRYDVVIQGGKAVKRPSTDEPDLD